MPKSFPEFHPRAVRDKAFAKRMEIACENHPLSPSGHGRQKWVRDRLLEDFGLRMSPEAVRKWFAGESRPRPKVMTKVAQVLQVDEAWLSLGINPAETPREKRRSNVNAAGAVNLVLAQIQLAGGNAAFEEESSFHDFFAIVKGQHHLVLVRMGSEDAKFKVSIPAEPRSVAVASKPKTIILVVPTETPTVFDFVNLPPDVVEAGVHKGGFIEVPVQREIGGYSSGGEPLPLITSFEHLEGFVPKPKVRRPTVTVSKTVSSKGTV